MFIRGSRIDARCRRSRTLRLEDDDTIFVTAFVAVLDPITRTLAYDSAGHPPPYLRHGDGRVEPLMRNDVPLGLRRSGESSGASLIDLPYDGLFVLYTDGLTEATRDPIEGERRLYAVLESEEIIASPSPARAIYDAVLEHRPSDDVAILTVRIAGNLSTAVDITEHTSRWRFDAYDATAAQRARHEFGTELRKRTRDVEDIHGAELVFGELVGNVARYAPGPVDVIVDWSTAGAPVLHVLDQGPGFQHLSIFEPDIYSESGRGLFIVSTLSEDFHVVRRPNRGSHARAVLQFRHRRF